MITFKDKQKTLFERIKRLRNNPTNSETIFKEKLEIAGIDFVFQKSFIKDNYYCIVDFYLPKPYKICIEIDGEYHFNEPQKVKDGRKDEYLKSRNFKVLRITNEVAETFDSERIFDYINSLRTGKSWRMFVSKSKDF